MSILSQEKDIAYVGIGAPDENTVLPTMYIGKKYKDKNTGNIYVLKQINGGIVWRLQGGNGSSTGGNISNDGVYHFNTDPTTNDKTPNYTNGNLWYNDLTKEVFELVDDTNGLWKKLKSRSIPDSTYDGNAGYKKDDEIDYIDGNGNVLDTYVCVSASNNNASWAVKKTRNPNDNDLYDVDTLWFNVATGMYFKLDKILNGKAIWRNVDGETKTYRFDFDPTSNENSAAGFKNDEIWINTKTKEEFKLRDAVNGTWIYTKALYKTNINYDSSKGYQVGDIVSLIDANGTVLRQYELLDATVGNAVWAICDIDRSPNHNDNKAAGYHIGDYWKGGYTEVYKFMFEEDGYAIWIATPEFINTIELPRDPVNGEDTFTKYGVDTHLRWKNVSTHEEFELMDNSSKWRKTVSLYKPNKHFDGSNGYTAGYTLRMINNLGQIIASFECLTNLNDNAKWFRKEYRDPRADDDETSIPIVEVGDLWKNVYSGEMFECLNASANNAQWTNASSGEHTRDPNEYDRYPEFANGALWKNINTCEEFKLVNQNTGLWIKTKSLTKPDNTFNATAGYVDGNIVNVVNSNCEVIATYKLLFVDADSSTWAYMAPRDPNKDDDIDHKPYGFNVNDIFINSSSNAMFECSDNTNGNAVWDPYNGTIKPEVSDNLGSYKDVFEGKTETFKILNYRNELEYALSADNGATVNRSGDTIFYNAPVGITEDIPNATFTIKARRPNKEWSDITTVTVKIINIPFDVDDLILYDTNNFGDEVYSHHNSTVENGSNIKYINPYNNIGDKKNILNHNYHGKSNSDILYIDNSKASLKIGDTVVFEDSRFAPKYTVKEINKGQYKKIDFKYKNIKGGTGYIMLQDDITGKLFLRGTPAYQAACGGILEHKDLYETVDTGYFVKDFDGGEKCSCFVNQDGNIYFSGDNSSVVSEANNSLNKRFNTITYKQITNSGDYKKVVIFDQSVKFILFGIKDDNTVRRITIKRDENGNEDDIIVTEELTTFSENLDTDIQIDSISSNQYSNCIVKDTQGKIYVSIFIQETYELFNKTYGGLIAETYSYINKDNYQDSDPLPDFLEVNLNNIPELSDVKNIYVFPESTAGFVNSVYMFIKNNLDLYIETNDYYIPINYHPDNTGNTSFFTKVAENVIDVERFDCVTYYVTSDYKLYSGGLTLDPYDYINYLYKNETKETIESNLVRTRTNMGPTTLDYNYTGFDNVEKIVVGDTYFRAPYLVRNNTSEKLITYVSVMHNDNFDGSTDIDELTDVYVRKCTEGSLCEPNAQYFVILDRNFNTYPDSVYLWSSTVTFKRIDQEAGERNWNKIDEIYVTSINKVISESDTNSLPTCGKTIGNSTSNYIVTYPSNDIGVGNFVMNTYDDDDIKIATVIGVSKDCSNNTIVIYLDKDISNPSGNDKYRLINYEPTFNEISLVADSAEKIAGENNYKIKFKKIEDISFDDMVVRLRLKSDDVEISKIEAQLYVPDK
jgi:hypothetical protein